MAENDEPMIQTPSDFGHFLLEKELGHGGMGGVYLARDKMLDRKVGIKVMLKSLGADPKFVERFQREAQAAARLNHPNIAQIYSFGQEQGMPYIAMELVPGGSLDKEMEANPGTLDVAYVMRVGQQVADALALAAESGLVHGDVKPENVLFDADGNAKLVDFGLAAMQGDSDEIWGTPFYISPEKVRRQKIDYRADIYSLGGTLYHVLTGVPPFDGPDPTAVVKARFEGPPKKPSEIRPDIPPEVDAIIMRMLELEPSMRYPTYQSLLGDFKRYLAKAGPAKGGKSSGPKLKFKGMKPKLSLSSTGNNLPVDGEVADLQPIDDLNGGEEEKKGMGVGAMVGMVVGGIVLLILLVAGGLWWYVSSTKAAEEAQNVQQIVDKQNKARQSIQKTVKTVQEDYAEFHKLVLKGDAAVEQAVREVKKVLPEEMQAAAAAVLAPAPSPLIADAVAFTNALFGVKAPPPPEAKPAATNATEAASAEKKDADKKDADKKADAKKADDKKDADKKADAKKDTKKADGKKKADAKKDAKKPEAKKDADEEDKDAQAEKEQEEAESKAEGKEAKKPDKKDAKKPDKKEEKEEEAPADEEKKEDDSEDEKPAEEAKPALALPSSVNNFLKLWDEADREVQGGQRPHGAGRGDDRETRQARERPRGRIQPPQGREVADGRTAEAAGRRRARPHLPRGRRQEDQPRRRASRPRGGREARRRGEGRCRRRRCREAQGAGRGGAAEGAERVRGALARHQAHRMGAMYEASHAPERRHEDARGERRGGGPDQEDQVHGGHAEPLHQAREPLQVQDLPRRAAGHRDEGRRQGVDDPESQVREGEARAGQGKARGMGPLLRSPGKGLPRLHEPVHQRTCDQGARNHEDRAAGVERAHARRRADAPMPLRRGEGRGQVHPRAGEEGREGIRTLPQVGREVVPGRRT